MFIIDDNHWRGFDFDVTVNSRLDEITTYVFAFDSAFHFTLTQNKI